MNGPLDSTYSDETSTGGRSDAFRGIGRATVAARVGDLDGFDWLLALKRDYFPDKLELKAPLVIEVMATRRIVQEQVLDHVSSATIIIVDFGEHYLRLLTRVCEMTGNPQPTRGEAIRHALERTLPREFIEDYLLALRGAVMLSTPIPKIETILRDILQETGSGVVDHGLLVDGDDLQAMKDPEFREFVARFSAAFADALAPDRQAEAILAAQSMGRLLTPGYIGSVTLGETVSVDRYFDQGGAHSFEGLVRAYDRVVSALKDATDRFFFNSLRGGALEQHDSALLLGIQAADIAARIAADEYQRFPDDRSGGLAAVKHRFDRVFLNDRWV